MIRVLVVASIRLYLEGLAESLARRTGITVVAMADDAQSAVSLAATLAPDVVLIDQTMPDGQATLRAINSRTTGVRSIALGVEDSETEVVTCAEAGISAYVPRNGSLEDLVHAIELAARGEALCSPRVAAALLRRIAGRTPLVANDRAQISLTTREAEIAALLAQRLANKEIAVRLGIEVATVKNHVHNLLEKLQVRRRGDAAAWFAGRTG